MAGSYYTQANVKAYLEIESGDSADDTLLDLFGNTANQHVDNILKQDDERIPLASGAVLNDIKAAADYYVCALYRGKRGDQDGSTFWFDKFNETISGIRDSLNLDSVPFIAERFNDRFISEDVNRLWY